MRTSAALLSESYQPSENPGSETKFLTISPGSQGSKSDNPWHKGEVGVKRPQVVPEEV